MAPIRLRFVMAGFLIAMTLVRLSQCQRRRECDCGAEGNITYVCLLRCGRGTSGGNVIVLPVKRLARPFLLETLQEKLASNQARTGQDTEDIREEESDPDHGLVEPLWTTTINRIREILNLHHVVPRYEVD